MGWAPPTGLCSADISLNVTTYYQLRYLRFSHLSRWRFEYSSLWRGGDGGGGVPDVLKDSVALILILRNSKNIAPRSLTDNLYLAERHEAVLNFWSCNVSGRCRPGSLKTATRKLHQVKKSVFLWNTQVRWNRNCAELLADFMILLCRGHFYHNLGTGFCELGNEVPDSI